MHHRGKASDSASKADRTDVWRVTIKAHGFERLHVGIYERGIPIPKLTVSTEPDIGDLLSAKLERNDDNGDYTLEYFLQNFSDQDCEVTVRPGGRIHGDSNLA
jgi:hypothetical protein